MKTTGAGFRIGACLKGQLHLWQIVPALTLLAMLAARAAEEPPREWIEPATGHRVVRLSREPGTASLYFHQNAYSADGRQLVVTTPSGNSTIDLMTREIEQIVPGRARVLVTGRKSGDVYFVRAGSVYAANLETHATREVAKIPFSSGRGGGNVTVNADETLLVGIAVDAEGTAVPRPLPGNAGEGRLGQRWAAGAPLVLYTLEIATGKLTRIHTSNDWSVHFNASPDGTLFAGDGGGPNSVANRGYDGQRLDPPGNGQWIYLFHPQKLRMTGLPGKTDGPISPGVLIAERLVDLSKHDYRLEPNVTFTPDGKWVVFRSNMHGPTHVYAVEVVKAR